MNHFLYYCQKTCDIAVALCKPENALHARTSQVTTKMGSARTLQLAEVRPYIASHALLVFHNRISESKLVKTNSA